LVVVVALPSCPITLLLRVAALAAWAGAAVVVLVDIKQIPAVLL
jgi:hypothetical protein